MNKAFTMIELVIVIVILGSIAIFVAPAYTKTISKSYEKSATDTLAIIDSAQRISLTNSGTYKTAAGTAAVNSALHLSILSSNGTDYSTTGDASSYTSTATISANGGFEVQRSGGSSTVCCSSGSCPTIPACVALGTACVTDNDCAMNERCSLSMCMNLVCAAGFHNANHGCDPD